MVLRAQTKTERGRSRGRAGLGWSLLGLLAGLILPWTRSGRNILAYDVEQSGAALAAGDALAAAVLAMFVLAAAAGLSRNPGRARGGALAGTAAVGIVLAAAWLVRSDAAFGSGMIVMTLCLLGALGSGLSYARLLASEPFVAVAILWMAAFVLLFILVPLLAVLEASIVVGGRLTLDAVRETLTSPTFFLLTNPYTEIDEGVRAVRTGLWAGAAGIVYRGMTLAHEHGRSRLASLIEPAFRGRALLRLVRSLVGWGIAGYVASALFWGFGALRNSVLLAVAVGSVSTALALFFALLGERTRFPIRRLMAPLSTLSMITPPFVLGLAMIYVFGRRGFITHAVLGLSTNAFFGPLGVGFAQVLAFTPLAYLVLSGVVQSLDASIEEAAQTLGSSRWRVYRTVVWPLLRPGVANAFLLGVIESLADFGNPIILGGGVPFLPTEVFFAIDGRFNQHEAAVYGLVLLLMTLGAFVIQRYWIGRSEYITVTGKPTGARPTPLPRPAEAVMVATFAAWALLAISLYASIIFGSFVRLWGFNNEFTTLHFANLSPSGWQVFWNSTRLAALSAIPSAAIGFLIAYLCGRHRFTGRGLLEFSSMLSFAIPGTVMGIGYILAFNTGTLYMTGTELIVVLAFVFRNMPVGIRSGIAALQQIDPSLEEASSILGARTGRTLIRIVLPLLLPSVIGGLMFSFVRAMTAISQVIFLVTPQLNLATVLILSWVDQGQIGRGAALSVMLILTMTAVVILLNAVAARTKRGWQGGGGLPVERAAEGKVTA